MTQEVSAGTNYPDEIKPAGQRCPVWAVEPVVKFQKGGKHVDTVFKRTDVMRVYGLDADPTILDDPRVNRFWEIIVPEAAKTCPYLIFAPKLPPSGQRVWNSNRGLSAHFQFDPGLGEIHINLSAEGERHKFWLDLNTEDYIAAIKDRQNDRHLTTSLSAALPG